MKKEKYAIACTEVLEILKYVSESDYNKIPENVIKVLEKNKKKNTLYLYNPWKSLDEQEISETGKEMLAVFYKNYWATEDEKKKICEHQKTKRAELYLSKESTYNSDNIFKKNIDTQQIETVEEPTLIKFKNNVWYKKIFDFIGNAFRKIIRK